MKHPLERVQIGQVRAPPRPDDPATVWTDSTPFWCVALRTTKCTMAPKYRSEYSTEKGRVDSEDVTAQRWRVIRRPTISVRGSTYEPFETYVVTPGVLRLDATGLNHDHDPVDFAQLCELDDFRLTARLSDAGVLSFPRDGDPVHTELTCTNAAT